MGRNRLDERGHGSGPPARTFAAFAYDTKNERAVLFGGHSDASGAPTLGDTWLYSMYAGSYASGSECTSGFCTDGVCCDVPSCGTCQTCAGASPGSCAFVGLGADPDTCGGAMSCDLTGACKAANGQMCTSAAACASGNCVDGVCCDTSCDGTCMACTAAGKKSGADGVCGPVAAGSDPRNVCSVDALHPCVGDGTCDGKGSCAITSAQTSCGAVVCDDNRSVGELCDGHGSCSESVNGVDCMSYICDRATGACLTSCASTSDCRAGSTCVGGKCVPSQAGGSCDGDHTVTAPDGKATDCSPYKCAGSSCQLQCASVADCSAGTICDGAGHCVTPSAPELASGCNVASARARDASLADARGGLGYGGFAALFALSRSLSRRRSARARRKVDARGKARR